MGRNIQRPRRLRALKSKTFRWEAVALSLADKSGIEIPPWRVDFVADRPVLDIQRLDRADFIDQTPSYAKLDEKMNFI